MTALIYSWRQTAVLKYSIRSSLLQLDHTLALSRYDMTPGGCISLQATPLESLRVDFLELSSWSWSIPSACPTSWAKILAVMSMGLSDGLCSCQATMDTLPPSPRLLPAKRYSYVGKFHVKRKSLRLAHIDPWVAIPLPFLSSSMMKNT